MKKNFKIEMYRHSQYGEDAWRAAAYDGGIHSLPIPYQEQEGEARLMEKVQLAVSALRCATDCCDGGEKMYVRIVYELEH